MLFTWNNVGDSKDNNRIWKGANPLSGERLYVQEGSPQEYDIPDLDEMPEKYKKIAKRLLENM